MRLLLTVPTHVVIDESTDKVTADSVAGSFTLLPRHLDLATVLVPGLLIFEREGGGEVVVAVDHGVLVKVDEDVRVACQRAFVTGGLGEAEQVVKERFHEQSEREKRSRAALARLETDVVRRLGELRGRNGG